MKKTKAQMRTALADMIGRHYPAAKEYKALVAKFKKAALKALEPPPKAKPDPKADPKKGGAPASAGASAAPSRPMSAREVADAFRATAPLGALV
jgi:hypothetical protein